MLDALARFAREAGELLREHYGHATAQYTKGERSDVVTDADVAVNALLVKRIRERFPDHGILAEESGGFQEQAEYVWYVDPLDGTVNYLSGIPLYAVLLAVAHQGKLQYAAVYDPTHDELALAAAGQGATLNGQPMHCSEQLDWARATGSIGARWNSERKRMNAKLFREERDVWANALGSTGISGLFVASGRRDWYFSLGSSVWDYAAPALLLQEAGCVVTDIEGQPWQLDSQSLLAANHVLHKELLRALRG